MSATKYLYTALAVLFGLPSLVMGGAAATMLLLMGLGQFGHGTLASVTVMPLWGLAGIAGCLAWLWLSAGFLLQGVPGCTCTASGGGCCWRAVSPPCPAGAGAVVGHRRACRRHRLVAAGPVDAGAGCDAGVDQTPRMTWPMEGNRTHG